ncbi:MAG: hypothetical protein KQH63_04995 [Desulfobulbaceae bacterium]|nr:hypothetical protein [Desulfobulbaceae bacterium]
MKKTSLLQTNPFLANKKQRHVLIAKTVISSSAIEGVHAAAKKAVEEQNKAIPALQSSKSASTPH